MAAGGARGVAKARRTRARQAKLRAQQLAAERGGRRLRAASPAGGRYRSPLKMEWEDHSADWGEPKRSFMTRRWIARGEIKAAQFRYGPDPTKYAILHPSTKEPGRWQLSSFDHLGAWGDVIRSTPGEAIKDGLESSGWRLEHVVGADGRIVGRRR